MPPIGTAGAAATTMAGGPSMAVDVITQALGGARGTAKDIEIQAKNILWMRQRINEIFAEKTGKPVEQIQEDTDRDNWMTAEEALEYGLIDEVVRPGSGS